MRYPAERPKAVFKHCGTRRTFYLLANITGVLICIGYLYEHLINVGALWDLAGRSPPAFARSQTLVSRWLWSCRCGLALLLQHLARPFRRMIFSIVLASLPHSPIEASRCQKRSR